MPLNPNDLKVGEAQYEPIPDSWANQASTLEKLIRYQYKASDGEVFSIISSSLTFAHIRRDKWLEHRTKRMERRNG